MSLWIKLLILFKATLARFVAPPEDTVPRPDQAVAKHRELLATARTGLVDISALRMRLERQACKLHACLPRFEDQAMIALAAGYEDQARIALRRQLVVVAELELLDRHVAEIMAEERRLTDAVLGLTARLGGFVHRYDIAAARSLVADSGASVRAVLRSMDAEIADLTTNLSQAEEWTRQMEDRAAALDALKNTDSRVDMDSTSLAQRELIRENDEQAIEDRLGELKTQLAQTRQKAQKERASQATATIP